MLIKNGIIVDPKIGVERKLDLLIKDGKIEKIGDNLEVHSDVSMIDADGMIVAPGLIDVHVHFRDPGFTYKEDIQSGAKAAAKGGFTTVVCMANTKPVVDNVETLNYILEEAQKAKINVLQAVCITKGMKGIELVDFDALFQNGAVGFTDDGIPIKDPSVVKKAMEEAVRLDVPISLHEEDPCFITNNGINSGMVSDTLGIEGSPIVAEDTMVARDCMIALDTGATVDIQHISSGNAVAIIRVAKSLGADIVAEVTPHHFSLDETAILKYGTLAKMNPPLRTKRDKELLIQGLIDGTIDVIATDHAPHSKEEKEKELTQAPSGIIGLETALSLGITHLVEPGYLTMVQLMEKMSYNPAKLYRLDKGYIQEGVDADLVIIDPKQRWIVDEFESKSKNSPFIGDELVGKVKYTICNGLVVYQD